MLVGEHLKMRKKSDKLSPECNEMKFVKRVHVSVLHACCREEKARLSQTCNSVICRDPHRRRVGHRRHAGLFTLLLLPVDDEEEEEEKPQQDKNDDTGNGSYLVGVHLYGCTGQTV